MCIRDRIRIVYIGYINMYNNTHQEYLQVITSRLELDGANKGGHEGLRLVRFLHVNVRVSSLRRTS